MFAAAPTIVSLLIRHYLATEAIKFATGTERKDWIKMTLDLSEQIGNIAEARLRGEVVTPTPFPTVSSALTDPVADPLLELITLGSAVLGAPGTAAETLGYTFPGAAARQKKRLRSEVASGFPFTRERIKGAPKFAKRKTSQWNRDIKKAYATVKANKNEFGMKGKINLPKKAFPKIVKIVSDIRKGRKRTSKAGKQIKKVLGYALKRKKKGKR